MNLTQQWEDLKTTTKDENSGDSSPKDRLNNIGIRNRKTAEPEPKEPNTQANHR